MREWGWSIRKWMEGEKGIKMWRQEENQTKGLQRTSSTSNGQYSGPPYIKNLWGHMVQFMLSGFGVLKM